MSWLAAWHGCLKHNRNHCPECRTCDHYQALEPRSEVNQMSDTWFNRLYAEFEERGEAMFAFSRKQVEDRGVTWEEFQEGWTSVGAGLHVKDTARVQFAHRMHTDEKAYLATLPELQVEYLNGTDGWDRPLYRVVDPVVEGKGVKRDQILCDVSLNPPNETTELHTMTPEGEPIAALQVRLAFVHAEPTETPE